MDPKEQTQNQEKSQISVLAQEKTYGERKYDFLLNTVVNFWVNLFVSGVFTYWVSHSKNEIKLPFLKKDSPSGIQKNIAEKIHDLPFMSVFGEKEAASAIATNRQKFATNAANVLTLVTGGHFVVIPSIWLGAKVKPAIVRWFDRGHYGNEAMDDPTLKARHEALDVEERPTFLGAVVGRIGAIFATQLASYTVGNPSNAVKWIGDKTGVKGLQRFQGIDEISGVIGDKTGEGIQQMLPTSTGNADHRLSHDGYSWSNQQMQQNPALSGTPYHGATQHLSKYLAQDVLYTVVTSVSIAPVINFVKQYIPGLTYKPKAAYIPADRPVEIVRGKTILRRDDEPTTGQPDMVDAPSATVSAAIHESTVTQRREHAVAAS